MTVYLIAQPSVSRNGDLPKLKPLAAWGPIQVLINPGEDPRYNPQLALQRIITRLHHFKADEDFLAWAGGDTLAAVLTGVVLADLSLTTDTQDGFNSFRWLRWERGKDKQGNRTDVDGHYVPITIPLPNDNDAIVVPDTYDGDST